jgi:prephenate dehydrogenase
MEYIGKIETDDRLEKDTKIVICGCGVTGKKVFECLQNKGLAESILGFCDTDSALQNTSYGEHQIYSYEDMTQQYKDATYLIACVDVRNVCEKLQALGVTHIHITR